MNFTTSLERIALVKVAVVILNNPENQDIVRIYDRPVNDGLCSVHERDLYIKQKISKCGIPNVLMEKILQLIPQIRRQFENWRYEHSLNFRHDFGRMNDICWNFLGTIDYMETAKRLVRSEDFTFFQRFPVACFYWLTNDVLRLWLAASTTEKANLIPYIFDRGTPNIILGIVEQWIIWLQAGAVKKRLYFYVKKFIHFPGVIPPPFEMWQELPSEEVKCLLRRILRDHFGTSIGRDIFSRMDANVRMQLFKEDPYSVLAMYLRWPLQTEFLEMAKHLYSSMDGGIFFMLIKHIISKICYKEESQLDYRILLKLFWLQSPDEFKNLPGIRLFSESIIFEYFFK
ncbi:uncharacterized protein NPIL_419661 [Nephila pilipes]|uniref:Uncharacterized protein n=1 Tax=Nephila pilipes TaxID=299642 RepID=A0A8X6QB86_NEPPI|nr:uncharacterized protein NPIL_419661 [Nephila pilipes]